MAPNQILAPGSNSSQSVKELDNTGARSKFEDHSFGGIAVGRDDKTITIVFCNPLTRHSYRSPAFCLDKSRLPVINFPSSTKYDGGLTCGLMHNKTDPVPEPFPPGKRVTIPTLVSLLVKQFSAILSPFLPWSSLQYLQP